MPDAPTDPVTDVHAEPTGSDVPAGPTGSDGDLTDIGGPLSSEHLDGGEAGLGTDAEAEAFEALESVDLTHDPEDGTDTSLPDGTNPDSSDAEGPEPDGGASDELEPEPEWDLVAAALAELPEVANEHLSLRVNPAKGGDILSLVRRRDGLDLLWRTPWALITPSRRPPATSFGRATEQWSGGWRSLFPNSGREVTSYGIDWGYDGEACLAAYRTREIEGGLELATRLARTPFRFTKRITLDGPRVRVTETVRNVSGQGIEIMWAQQVCLGAPLLSASAVIETGATVVRPEPDTTSGVSYDDLMPWPRTQGRKGMLNLRRVPEEKADTTRQAYLSDFTDHHLKVSNPDLGVAVDLTWDADVMPFLWYELESGGRANFPHFSNSYYLSLSPASAWPRQGVNDARLHSSSSRWIFPGDELTSWVELTVSDLDT